MNKIVFFIASLLAVSNASANDFERSCPKLATLSYTNVSVQMVRGKVSTLKPTKDTKVMLEISCNEGDMLSLSFPLSTPIRYVCDKAHLMEKVEFDHGDTYIDTESNVNIFMSSAINEHGEPYDLQECQ